MQDVMIFLFQSTRPVRGATSPYLQVGGVPMFQSTRPVRGATTSTSTEWGIGLFQSTRPVRGATRNPAFLCASRNVSIHAPRAGRDHSRRL